VIHNGDRDRFYRGSHISSQAPIFTVGAFFLFVKDISKVLKIVQKKKPRCVSVHRGFAAGVRAGPYRLNGPFVEVARVRRTLPKANWQKKQSVGTEKQAWSLIPVWYIQNRIPVISRTSSSKVTLVAPVKLSPANDDALRWAALLGISMIEAAPESKPVQFENMKEVSERWREKLRTFLAEVVAVEQAADLISRGYFDGHESRLRTVQVPIFHRSTVRTVQGACSKTNCGRS